MNPSDSKCTPCDTYKRRGNRRNGTEEGTRKKLVQRSEIEHAEMPTLEVLLQSRPKRSKAGLPYVGCARQSARYDDERRSQSTHTCLRCIVQDLVDLVQNFWRKFGNDIESLEIFEKLFRFRSTQNDCRRVRVLRYPSKGERGKGRLQL